MSWDERDDKRDEVLRRLQEAAKVLRECAELGWTVEYKRQYLAAAHKVELVAAEIDPYGTGQPSRQEGSNDY